MLPFYIAIVIIGYFVVTGIATSLYERFCPFTIDGVSPEQVEEHVRELYRRGYHNSEMLFLPVGTDVIVAVHKDLPSETICLLVDVRFASNREGACANMRQTFKSVLAGHDVRIREAEFRRRGRTGVYADCGADPAKAALVAGLLCAEILRLNGDKGLRVRTKGTICWRDIAITTRYPNGFTSWSMTLSGCFKPGRPYKHRHVPNERSPFYMLGKLFGRIVRGFRS